MSRIFVQISETSQKSVADFGLLDRIPPVPPGLHILLVIGSEPAPVSDDRPSPLLVISAALGTVIVGPLFERGIGVCPSCLRYWLKTARAQDSAPDGVAGDSEFQVILNVLADTATFFAPATTTPLSRQVCQCDTKSGRQTWHPLYPRRDCPDCRSMPIRENTPLNIHCSPLTSIVRHVEVGTRPFAGAWRASAQWNSPLAVNGARPPLIRQESYGRGRTRQEALNGCIAEALERYSIIYRGDEPLLRARLDQIGGGIDPRTILQYSDAQYRTRHDSNRDQDDRYFVGEPFDPAVPIDWMPASHVLTGATSHIPAACALMWYQFPRGEPEFARADSIGCAAGRTFEDALLAALFEIIERDAVAIWWYNRVPRPAVRIEDAELRLVSSGLKEIGRELVLLDCTTDIQVPVCVAVAARPGGSEPFFAAAASLSPRAAAVKAATEVGQMWFDMMHSGTADPELYRFITDRTTASNPYLAGAGETGLGPEPPPITSAEAVRQTALRLRACGLEAFAADLSRPDVLLKAARAIVPGLAHVWNRRGASRLYRVPITLGWSSKPLAEEDLNPVLCML
jgi:ribosomal protein S12 methylthiotransferase accessory factor